MTDRYFHRKDEWTGKTVRYRFVRETIEYVWGIPATLVEGEHPGPQKFRKRGSARGGKIVFEAPPVGEGSL